MPIADAAVAVETAKELIASGKKLSHRYSNIFENAWGQATSQVTASPLYICHLAEQSN